jgi:hypothetical protein
MRLPRVARWLYPLACFGAAVCAPIALWMGLYLLGLLFIALFVLARGIERFANIDPKDIIYFRSFHDRPANWNYYSRVGPVGDCFGRSFTVDAEALFSLGSLEKVANALTRRINRFGSIKLTAAGWRGEVRAMLPLVGVVIVDLSSESDSVAWELAATIELLGKDRILLLRPDANSAVPSGLEGIASVAHASQTLERDVAQWLELHLGAPDWIGRQMLNAFLEQGRCVQYLSWALLKALTSVLELGLGVSSKSRKTKSV